MSSQVEGPRCGAPIGAPGRHKQDHERRNQELQKRSFDGPLSKSLTEDPHARVRARKKDPLAGKSFMKATSSSSQKKTMDSRDVSPSRVRKREPSPSKLMSKSDHQVLRRTSSRKSVDSSHRKSMDASKLSVFDRLSKTDSYKDVSKTETQVSKSIKRRSGVFSDVNGSTDSNKEISKAEIQVSKSFKRRSGVFSDLNGPTDSNKDFSKADTQVSKSIKRRSGVFSDVNGPTAAVPLRRDSNVHRSARTSGKRDSKAEISEKYKGEEKPETSDKDAKDKCTSIKNCDAEHLQKQHVALNPAGHHVGVVTATTDPHQALNDGCDKGVVVTGTGSIIPTTAAVEPIQAHDRSITRTSPPNLSQQQGKRPTGETNKTKTKDMQHKALPISNKSKPSKAPGATVPASKLEPVKTVQTRDDKKSHTAHIDTSPKPKTQKHAAPAESKANSPSVAAVSRLAERVITGQVKPKADHDAKVLDDDKDVCDDDKAAEDREFYRIKVQTRLVSYENNTLVIKNTSNPEQCQESSDSGSTDSLQASSAEEVPVDSLDHMPPTQGHHDCEVMENDVAHSEEGEGFTRSRSLRLKMSQFMNKGKSFLSDVYSSTHQSLQPHLSQLPEMTRSFQQKMSRSLTSECSSDAFSIMSFSSISSHDDHGDITSNLPVTDTDSGYYSIHTTPDQGHTQQHDAEQADTIEINNNNTEVLSYVPDDTDIQVLTEPVQTECDEQGSPGEDLEHTDHPDDAPEILINDDWIKRCIVNCSCQCRQSPKDPVCPSEGNLDSGHGSNSSLDSNSDAIEQGSDEVGTSGAVKGPGIGVSDLNVTPLAGSSISGIGECQCECHSCGATPEIQRQIPQEVQDLLDADHARMWWTITGNFGNILPIDWSKTYTRQQYLPVLNLNEAKDNMNNESDEGEGGEEEDVAQDLDLHHLILTGLNEEPVKSAEEVIREIDDIMQEGSSSEDEGLEETMSCSTETQSTQPEMRPLPPPLYEEKLKNLSVNELNEHYMELEVVIRQYSETLINQLALRDELEYEKELKNSFISLLLQVQNKRRNFNVEKKQKKKYLTTVIPYDVGHGPPSNQTLQILIKILTAINEDSPTVPTLLTDYILKVLCPS